MNEILQDPCKKLQVKAGGIQKFWLIPKERFRKELLEPWKNAGRKLEEPLAEIKECILTKMSWKIRKESLETSWNALNLRGISNRAPE